MARIEFGIKELVAAEAAHQFDQESFARDLLALPVLAYQQKASLATTGAAALVAYGLSALAANSGNLSPRLDVVAAVDRVTTPDQAAPAIRTVAHHTSTAKRADTIIVHSGDTLSAIADANHMTVAKIVRLNPEQLKNPNAIYPGEVLNIRNLLAAAKAAELEDYTVELGDSLSRIATSRHESLATLEADNPVVQSHPDDIQVGDHLQVKAGPTILQVKPYVHHASEPQPPRRSSTHDSLPQPREAAPQLHEVNPDTQVKALPAAGVSKILPAASVEAVATNTPLIMAALTEQDINNVPMTAYTFATINAETSSFKPIPEWATGSEYEDRADLGNVNPGDGVRFKGRGFIQLTGRSNYKNMGTHLGIDLIDNPDLALDPTIAARIMAVWLKGHQHSIENDLANNDLASARAVVNGRNQNTGLPNGLDAFTVAYTAAAEVVAQAVTPPATANNDQIPTGSGPAAGAETKASANPEITTEDQAKQLCDSLGISYSGIQQGFVEGVEHDIFSCQIPAAFTFDNDPHYINVTIAADTMGFLNDQKAAGNDLKVISAFRTMDLSKHLRVQNGCADVMLTAPGDCAHPTAIPGFSNHQFGEAFDLVHADGSAISNNDADYGNVTTIAAQHNFHANVANDANHFSQNGR